MSAPSSAVIWLTGLPGSGKTTIARGVAAGLRGAGLDPCVLDGDEVRRTLSRDLGFSLADRDENVRRVAVAAARHFRAGDVVIVALISPLRRQRAAARRLVGPGFVEVHVHASLETCIRRDPKGLYGRALAGALDDLTGISSPYEPPLEPDLFVDTEVLTADEAAARVLASRDLAGSVTPRA